MKARAGWFRMLLASAGALTFTAADPLSGEVDVTEVELYPVPLFGLREVVEGGLVTPYNVTALSADGAVAVGARSTLSRWTFQAFRWDQNDMVDLGVLPGTNESGARFVSSDGSVVVGVSYVDHWYGPSRAFHWKDGVMTDLGSLSGTTESSPTAISADGTVVVGVSYSRSNHTDCLDCIPEKTRAFRWEDGILIDLGFLPGADSARAIDVSNDGSIIVGQSGKRSFRWENGVMTDLGALPGTSGVEAEAVSADGFVVVGTCSSDDGTGHAFRWESGVMTDLGIVGRAEFVSDDGSVVFGRTGDGNLGGWPHAVLWQNGTISRLKGSSDGSLWPFVDGISADGSVAVGQLAYFYEHDGAIWGARDGWEPHLVAELLAGQGVTGARVYYSGEQPAVSADGSTIAGVFHRGSQYMPFRMRLEYVYDSVAIADANLERAIRAALGKPDGDLTTADMESLTELSAPAMGISDLTGLESAVNLTALDLGGNEIRDLNALAGLAHLQRLDVAGNCIDLTPGSFAGRIIDRLLAGGATCYVEAQQVATAGNHAPGPANLSTRGRVGAGDEVLIAGFVLNGADDMQVLVRGIGPSLVPFGVTGALPSPVMQIHRNGTGGTPVLVAEVRDAGGAAERLAAEHCGAFPLVAAGGDAAVLTRLAPGIYTVTLSGRNAAEGIGMIEVYSVP